MKLNLQALSLIWIYLFLGLSLSAQTNMEFVGNVPYPQGANDIWGYAAPDGHEYALVGTITGVSVVDLETPAEPKEIFFADGVLSTWRDIKTHKGYAYVINESSNGLMVIDLTTLPDSSNHYDWTPSVMTGMVDSMAVYDTLRTCHNIYIDEFGYGYLAGCNLNGGGLIVIDVNTNPGVPEIVSYGAPIYSHDVFVRDNIAYSSEIYAGEFALYDVSYKDSIVLVATAVTERRFTHNTWLSDDSQTLFTTDERRDAPVGAYDISDPNDIVELDQFRPGATLGLGVVPHNTHVLRDWLVISYYTDGCVVVDASRPSNLVEVANYDTFDGADGGTNGAWGAYPFLPSGLVLISDRANGLFVVNPTYIRAAWIEGSVVDAITGEPINGATLTINDLGLTDVTDPNGGFATGHHQSGAYELVVAKEGYESQSVQAFLQNGEVDLKDVQLMPIQSSVDDLYSNQIRLVVSPNPSSIFFTIDHTVTSDREILIVHDIHGKLIEQVELTKKNKVTFGENYRAGVYFAHITNGTSNTRSQRLVKL